MSFLLIFFYERELSSASLVGHIDSCLSSPSLPTLGLRGGGLVGWLVDSCFVFGEGRGEGVKEVKGGGFFTSFGK